MKWALAAVLTAGAASTAQAQLSAGTTLLGGGIGYNRITSQTDATSTLPSVEQRSQYFNFSPIAGYFVADNVAVGLNLNWGLSTNRAAAILTTPVGPGGTGGQVLYIENRTRQLRLGAFGRRYWFLGAKAAFYGQVGGGYLANRYDTDRPELPETLTSRSAGFYGQLQPGFTYFATPAFALELGMRGLTYEYQGYDGNQDVRDSSTSYFDLGLRLRDLRFGAAFYLGRSYSL